MQGVNFAPKTDIMNLDVNSLLTVTFTLFAVIDIVGSIPLLLSLKKKMGVIHEWKATLISGALMIFALKSGRCKVRAAVKAVYFTKSL